MSATRIGEHDEDRAEEDDALDRGQVSVLDRIDRVAPHTGNVEDRLDEDRAAEEDPEIESGETDDRSQAGAHAVPHHDPAFAHSLGTRRAHVVLCHRFTKVLADQPGIQACEAECKHDPGPEQRLEPRAWVLTERYIGARSADQLEASDVATEQEERDEGQPVGRSGEKEQRRSRYHAISLRAGSQRSEDADR